MNQKKFTPAGHSILSPKENKNRKAVKVQPLKCWLEDYEKEIATDPAGRYYLRHDSKGQLMTSEKLARYKIYVPLRSNAEIVVEVRFKIVSGIDVFNNFQRMPVEDALQIKPIFEQAVAGWNDMFKLKITDPKCGVRSFPIKYVVVWTENDFHYEASIVKSKIRESVGDGRMNLSSNSVEATISHEYAHCLGIPDEYTDEHEPEFVSYIRPDGTLEEKIKAVRGGKAMDEPDASFMGSHNRTFFDYHAWNIAIEVQELLREQLQRKIVCDIF